MQRQAQSFASGFDIGFFASPAIEKCLLAYMGRQGAERSIFRLGKIPLGNLLDLIDSLLFAAPVAWLLWVNAAP